MEKRNIGILVDAQRCTGCLSCYASCDYGAIFLKEDEEGFICPEIKSDVCTECGRCSEVCPLCNPLSGTPQQEDCFAVMASDEVRMKCSSGGVFPVYADYVLRQGGYVAGAVFTETFMVKHIVSNQRSDVERMFSSKYVQSDCREVYPVIKDLLEQGVWVLFSGCACQVAALHLFLLKKEYPNLLTLDVVCHGVPSAGIWRNYVQERKFSDISFRDKSSLGWSSGFCAKDEDGKKTVEPGMDNEYMFAFVNSWILRKACYDCQFKTKKYSDITCGDFWGINCYASFDDGLGTSFMTINTRKGIELFKHVKESWKKVSIISTEAAINGNTSILYPVKEPKFRKVFFEQYDKKSLADSIYRTKEKVHFDIGLVTMWSQNYGNALTNYGLYTYLKKQGYSVLAVDNYFGLYPVGVLREFTKSVYELSSDYFCDYDVKGLNETCDCFMVGSDQCWNYFTQKYCWEDTHYFYLDLIEDGKKKLSYGTSFGQPEAVIPEAEGRTLFHRFDAISTREEFGVQIFRDKYGITAEKVVDSVFLLDREDYERLAEKSDCREEEPFIMTYILNPTVKKRELCLEIQRRLDGIPLINVLDCDPENNDYNCEMMEYDNVKCQIPLEDWLYYMKNCQYVITDSFHGTCFSLIFDKPVVTIRNRQKARFATFEKYEVLANRIIEEDGEWQFDEWMKEVDYELVWKELNKEIEQSKEFLRREIGKVF